MRESLQWGRAPGGTESDLNLLHAGAAIDTSMGPRPGGTERLLVETVLD